jgi:hypothetical protein
MVWRGSGAKVGDLVDSDKFTVIDDTEKKRTEAAKKRQRGADGGDNAAPAAKKANIVKTTMAQEREMSLFTVLHLVHRVAIFACAVAVMVNCLSAMNISLDLLYGVSVNEDDSTSLPFSYMKAYLGESAVRDSPLVVQGLGNDTTPRNGTLYISSTGMSFTQCPGLVSYHQIMYGDEFLRSVISAVQADPAKILKHLKPENFELIAPVVDCASPLILIGFRTVGRYFYLMRNVTEPDNVHVLTITLSTNEYSLPAQVEKGPTALAEFSIVNDTSASAPDAEHTFLVSIGYPFSKLKFRIASLVGTDARGLWELDVLPWVTKGEILKTIYTASRTGFYLTSEDEQSNTNNNVWQLFPRPIDAVVQIEYSNTVMMYNTWAWVRIAQGLVALILFSNLVILFIIFLRNLQAGKIWIGDAFVSSLGVLHVQGIWVMMYWYIEEFWSISEFCIHDANEAANIEHIHVYPSIVRADLLAIYISLCSWIGVLMKDRVDPIVVIVTFMIGYEYRASIRQQFPSVHNDVKAIAIFQYFEGYLEDNPFQQEISPMVSLSTRELSAITKKFLADVLFPVFFMLMFVVLYVIARKVFVRLFPEKLHVLRSKLTSGTATSENNDSLLAKRSNYTMFEIATGAEMQKRYGMLADYEACVFIKGVKYATADGIYSNGFVIANQKFLLQTEDYWYIVLMKLLRWRFTNIYVFEVNETNVQQRARLVYPQTLTWTDLVFLNLKILT